MMNGYKVYRANGMLCVDRVADAMPLPIEEVIPHALYEVAFYDFHALVHDLDAAIAAYEEFEAAYIQRLNDEAKPYC